MKFYRNKKNHLTDSLSWSGMLLINVLNHINYNNNDKLFNFTSSIQLSSRLRLRLERKEKQEKPLRRADKLIDEAVRIRKMLIFPTY